jgi:hypothetical protein
MSIETIKSTHGERCFHSTEDVISQLIATPVALQSIGTLSITPLAGVDDSSRFCYLTFYASGFIFQAIEEINMDLSFGL